MFGFLGFWGFFFLNVSYLANRKSAFGNVFSFIQGYCSRCNEFRQFIIYKIKSLGPYVDKLTGQVEGLAPDPFVEDSLVYLLQTLQGRKRTETECVALVVGG